MFEHLLQATQLPEAVPVPQQCQRTLVRWMHGPSSLLPPRASTARRRVMLPAIALAVMIPTLMACGAQEPVTPTEAESPSATRAATSAGSGSATGNSPATSGNGRNTGNGGQREPVADSAPTQRPTTAPTPTKRPAPNATETPEPATMAPDPMDEILKLLDPPADEADVIRANNVSTTAFRRALARPSRDITEVIIEEYALERPETQYEYNLILGLVMEDLLTNRQWEKVSSTNDTAIVMMKSTFEMKSTFFHRHAEAFKKGLEREPDIFDRYADASSQVPLFTWDITALAKIEAIQPGTEVEHGIPLIPGTEGYELIPIVSHLLEDTKIVKRDQQ